MASPTCNGARYQYWSILSYHRQDRHPYPTTFLDSTLHLALEKAPRLSYAPHIDWLTVDVDCGIPIPEKVFILAPPES